MKKKIILICAIIFLAGLAAFGICLLLSKKNKSEETTTEAVLITEEEIVVATPADATYVEPEQTEFDRFDEKLQDKEFTAILNASSHTYDELIKKEIRQVVIVAVEGTTADVSMYELIGGTYCKTDISCSGHVGANGASDESYEGSKMTPVGMFPVLEAFYIEDMPSTRLDTFEVTEDVYWVDDPESEQYNQKVVLEGEKTFKSAEHMIEYSKAYKYGFVIGFNMEPVVAGKGSAIFFHVGDGVTAGCVSVSEENVLEILSLLDKDKNPYIIIYNK